MTQMVSMMSTRLEARVQEAGHKTLPVTNPKSLGCTFGFRDCCKAIDDLENAGEMCSNLEEAEIWPYSQIGGWSILFGRPPSFRPSDDPGSPPVILPVWDGFGAK